MVYNDPATFMFRSTPTHHAMTSYSVIQEIKDRLDVVTVIGRYVPLQKSGNSYKGLCPFHSEKTPSFHVFPHTNTWKCFGCGAGGDIFTFVEKRENLPFPDVLRMLAKEAGVPLREVRPEERDARQRLLDLHQAAASYFQSNLLTGAAGKRARDYLAQRDITQETIERFQLGYALDGWERLLNHLQGKGFSLEEIVKAGLAIARDAGGAYDRFRNRLIIPIRDIQGRVIAFGGRILGEGEPKYLNSPQTPIFDKSQAIFGLDMARRTIRASDQVVLVEGYMDVISAHQRGFKNVVAAMGTSITAGQIRLLSRYSRNFVFALDADAAGARATWRGVMLVQETLAERGALTPTASGFRAERRMFADVSIAIMPEGQDPDDVLRQDPERWRTLIENAVPVVDYIIQQAAARFDLATASGKAQFVSEALPTLSKIGDPIQRRHYIGRVAALARVRETDVEAALGQYERGLRRPSTSRKPPAPTLPPALPPHPALADVDAPPPERVLAGASEEPPLWLDDVSRATPDVSEQRPRRIGPEEHLLGLILLHHERLLPWLDDELAHLELDPFYIEDFTDPLNRALFQSLEDYIFDAPEEPLADYIARQDDAIGEHVHFLWRYAQEFEETKPRYVQESHLQRDVITSLLRLRLEKAKAALQQLEVALQEAMSPEERRGLDRHLFELLQFRNKLEKSLSRYSQTMHWTHNRRATASISPQGATPLSDA